MLPGISRMSITSQALNDNHLSLPALDEDHPSRTYLRDCGVPVSSLTLKGREFHIRNKTTYTGKGRSSVYGTNPQNEGK